MSTRSDASLRKELDELRELHKQATEEARQAKEQAQQADDQAKIARSGPGTETIRPEQGED